MMTTLSSVLQIAELFIVPHATARLTLNGDSGAFLCPRIMTLAATVVATTFSSWALV